MSWFYRKAEHELAYVMITVILNTAQYEHLHIHPVLQLPLAKHYKLLL
jgi:hypothetical protein